MKVSSLGFFHKKSLGVPTQISLVFGIAVYFLSVVWASLSNRGFFADGSFFFVDILNQDSSWPTSNDPKHNRFFSNLLNQFPLVTALKLGVENYQILRFLFNAGLFLLPILLLVGLWMLSRNRASNYFSLFFTSSFLLAVIPSTVFSLNQAIIASCLFWYQIFYSTQTGPLRKSDWLILFLINIYFYGSHESMLIWSPIVGIYVLYLLWRKRSGDWRRNQPHLVFILLNSVMQFSFMFYWQQTHPVKDETSGFLGLLVLLNPANLISGAPSFGTFQLIFMVLVFAFANMLWYSCPALARVGLLISFLVLLALAVNQVLLLIVGETQINPGMEFSYRILVPVITLVFTSSYLLLSALKVKVTVPLNNFMFFFLGLNLVFASIWQATVTAEWLAFEGEVKRVLVVSESGTLSQSQFLSQTDQALKENTGLKYDWGWTWPAYSIALQAGEPVRVIIAPADHLENFDVSNANNGSIEIPFSTIYTNSHIDLGPLANGSN